MGYYKKYTAGNGKTLNAALYKNGMEDDICLKHNKPVIHTNNKIKYVTTEDYIFIMDNEIEKMILHKDIFEKYAKIVE